MCAFFLERLIFPFRYILSNETDGSNSYEDGQGSYSHFTEEEIDVHVLRHKDVIFKILHR